MKVTNYELLNRFQMEANKFWVYGILASIFVSIYQLSASFLRTHPENAATKTGAQTGADQRQRNSSQTSSYRPVLRQEVVRQLIIDCCDFVVAGTAARWVSGDDVQVGVAYTVSTILSGSRLWQAIHDKGN